uniref:Uncharacterized protein n=1 Tax=Anguilla anguilla TaxID=7936 RepID=A0A0E9QNZ9_ANGAN
MCTCVDPNVTGTLYMHCCYSHFIVHCLTQSLIRRCLISSSYYFTGAHVELGPSTNPIHSADISSNHDTLNISLFPR